MPSADETSVHRHADTALIHAGRTPAVFGGFVNTPVYRGSTILAESFDEWERGKRDSGGYGDYGRFGNPTTCALESAVAELERGYRAQVFPSGLSACTHTLTAFLKSGDHLLISDSVYGPTRTFADSVLKRFGVDVEYFDPIVGPGIRMQLRANTRVVFIESPGSHSMDILDVPAIADAAHARGAVVILDNSWASPLYFKPLALGVDVSVQAATKYLVGHSDALLGVATATERAWPQLVGSAHAFGETAGPDDVYLALRGLRTLGVRLRQHWQTGIMLAESLLNHPAVEAVLHPALPGHPGHDIWKRDFGGASGLFSIVLKPIEGATLAKVFRHLQLFGLGLSWGGYESLALPVGRPLRTASEWPYKGPLVRIHAGLEDPQDLMQDLHAALHQALKK